MKYYYLDENWLKKAYPCVIETREESINDYEMYFLQRELVVKEYVGEYLPERLVWDEKLKKVREATEQEKYKLDPSTFQLQEDKYYIKDDEVKELPTLDIFMLKPLFNINLEEWIETATSIELKNYEDATYREFYYKELEDFNKATSEYNAGVMNEEEYKECQDYIKFLASQLNSDKRIDMTKPLQMRY